MFSFDITGRGVRARGRETEEASEADGGRAG